ncbi:glutathione S-transferase N-terminal domain-containing protein [Citrobacter amalonaticus]|uniref:oxidoreductase n=1 Tax=Citrobacter amalonaticus TaxID=35703 RepID=UPI00045FDBE1|nr:glutathione S-transferase N-terminal domain-containing protein [Citrobacter amalonaticus]
MSEPLLLIEHPLSPYAQKIRIMMREKGIVFSTYHPVVGDKNDVLRRQNPRMEVPVLKIDDTTMLYDSTVILEYLEEAFPETSMLPPSPLERAMVRTIEDVCDTHFEAINWGLLELKYFRRGTDISHDLYAAAKHDVPGHVQASLPRALETDEIPRITQDFVDAGNRAIEAGFDGVEVHGAHGHIFEQFINGELNTRQDRYGGSIENRLRFLLETLDALTDAIGGQHVGVRLSPFGRLLGMRPFADEAETWLTAARELGQRNLAYVNLSNQHTMGTEHDTEFFNEFRNAYEGTLIIAGGYSRESAEDALKKNKLDLVGFAHHFVSNPDLVDRLKNDYPLAGIDGTTLYGLYGSRGYTDYPRYSE